MSTFNIFIVEDDPWYGEILEYHLSLNPDYIISRYVSANECLSNLHKQPDLITVDYSLPDMQGDKLFLRIKEALPDVPVVIISGQEQISVAVSLLKLGVYDYIIKDDNTRDVLWNTVIKVRETCNLKKEVETLREELGQKYDFEKSIIGQSAALKKIFTLMEKAINTNINVSITGETGTGKEVVAKAIHYNGPRRKKNFVAVNMAAIPKELLESELFGHEKGAFTGAIARKAGKFEEANGGTIFLDEIAEMDLSMQTKLLRVLQEREVVRVGGNESVKLDVRVVVATHKYLPDEVKKGNFREDLYYRIMGLPIELPPLRERGNDILLLAKYFLDEFTKNNKLQPIQLTAGAREKLLGYNFPGNVRELKALMDLAAVMCANGEISPDDITFTATRGEDAFMATEKSLREHTCDVIQFYLNKYDKDVLLVAKKLDVGKSTLYRMIQAGEVHIS